MNSDIRLLISFRGHHKRKRLKRHLGEGYLDHLIDLWLAVAMHRPDGILEGWTIEDIADYGNWDGEPDMFVQGLVKSGWLDVLTMGIGGTTFKCHDWEKHQPWLLGSKERQDKARKAALTKHYGAAEAERLMQQACTKHAPSMQQAEPSMPSACAPSPSPLPIPKDNGGDKPPPGGTKKEVPPCPQKEIIFLYHKYCPMLPKVRQWTASREKMLRARWKEDPARQTPTWWHNYFKQVAKSDFLTGKTDKPFYADLEWLVRPSNLVKVIEGKYQNRQQAAAGHPGPVLKAIKHPNGKTCANCGFYDRCQASVPATQNFCSAAVNDSRFYEKTP